MLMTQHCDFHFIEIHSCPRVLHCRFQNYSCPATPQPHREDAPAPEKMTVMEEEERKIILERTVLTTTTSVI